MKKEYPLASFWVRLWVGIFDASLMYVLRETVGSKYALILIPVIGLITLTKFGGYPAELLLQTRAIDIKTKNKVSPGKALLRGFMLVLLVIFNVMMEAFTKNIWINLAASSINWLWVLLSKNKQTLVDWLSGIILVNINPNYRSGGYPLKVKD